MFTRQIFCHSPFAEYCENIKLWNLQFCYVVIVTLTKCLKPKPQVKILTAHSKPLTFNLSLKPNSNLFGAQEEEEEQGLYV